jgi:thiamine pyrophosphate-dependent acetolactate synthase large subunit-like protein
MRAAKQAVRLLRGNERHILIGYGSVTAQAADTAKAILGKIRIPVA